MYICNKYLVVNMFNPFFNPIKCLKKEEKKALYSY